VVSLIEGQIQGRLNQTLKPVDSTSEALIQNFQKGIAAGMRLTISFPLLEAERLQEEFKAMLDKERE